MIDFHLKIVRVLSCIISIATAAIPSSEKVPIFRNLPGKMKTPPNASSIINGDLAKPDEFKYIALVLHVNTERQYLFMGSGVILDDKWILTSRHNIIPFNGNENT